MRKLIQLVVSGTFLCALAFASAASAGGGLGLVAGPMPIGMQASFNGAKCVFRAHTTQSRDIRIRRGDTGAIVASWSGTTVKGSDYVVTASYFALGGAGKRAVCETRIVNTQSPCCNSPDVLDGQLTLQTLTWYGNTIETVTGVTGYVAPLP